MVEHILTLRNLVYRSSMPKLDRTMTDIYADELYDPSFGVNTTPSAIKPACNPQNDVFSQRLNIANDYLNASKTQVPMTLPPREISPFRRGSPPLTNSFTSEQPAVIRFGTATHMRDQQNAEINTRILQQQPESMSAEHSTSRTISPKDAELIYHENGEYYI
jgi:26S proteasome regulatory subunit N4